MDNLVELFCDVDDFCHQFSPKWEAQLLSDGTRNADEDLKFLPVNAWHTLIRSKFDYFHLKYKQLNER